MNFYTKEELLQIGVQIGDKTVIHKTVLFFGNSNDSSNPNIIIGNNTRIDAYSIITCSSNSKVTIGNFTHISAGVYLYGSYGITVGNYVAISSRCSVFSGSDDYSGSFLNNPMVPEKYTNVKGEHVYFDDVALIGAGCAILPGVHIGFGSSVGALCVVAKDVPECVLMAGNPLKVFKTKDKQKIVSLIKEHQESL